jgi:hypothetical protein
MKLFFTKSDYFNTLFPTVKEQKPGKDLYAPMAIFQLIIILYLILFYTEMDPNFKSHHRSIIKMKEFSPVMVILVFIQIMIMIFDRYLYLAKTVIVIDKMEIQNRESEVTGAGDSKEVDKNIDSSADNQLKKVSSGHLDGSLHDKEDSKQKEDIHIEITDFNSALVLKYYLQVFLLIVVHALVFWFFPTKVNNTLQGHAYCDYEEPDTSKDCNEVHLNWSLMIFYILYCFYFLFSALQIRYGHPELRKGNFLMKKGDNNSRIAFQIFLAIPFLYELKVFADWTFTKTSLGLPQWLTFERLYADLYISGVASQREYNHPLGKPQEFHKKLLIGFMGMIGMILCIAGPLLLFSSLNPTQESNHVTGCKVQLSIEIKEIESSTLSEYIIYESENAAKINSISDKYWDRISVFKETRNYKRESFQEIIANKEADMIWDITPPTHQNLYNQLNQAQQINSGHTAINQKENIPVYLKLELTFYRPVSTHSLSSIASSWCSGSNFYIKKNQCSRYRHISHLK